MVVFMLVLVEQFGCSLGCVKGGGGWLAAKPCFLFKASRIVLMFSVEF